MLLVRTFLAVVIFSSACFAEERFYPCHASAEIAQALAGLPPYDNDDLTWAEGIGPARSLVQRYPNDIFVQLRYQDTFRRQYWLAEEYDRALVLYSAMPDKTLGQFLRARLLWHSRLRESREALEQLLQIAPSFPWTHLVLVEMAEPPATDDSFAAETHLRAFLDACPDALEAYDHFQSVKDPQLIRDGVERLRKLLASRTDAAVWHYYRDLWDLEFRATQGHEQARQGVRDDVKRLQSLEPVPSREWYLTFSVASDLAGDPALKNWMKNLILSKFPDSSLAFRITEERWEEEHPKPPPGKFAEWPKWNLDRFAAFDEWRRRWPHSPSPILEQHFLLLLPEVSTEKALEVMDSFATVTATHPDIGVGVPPVQIMEAQEYVKRKVRLDRVPQLIEAGLQQSEIQEKYRPDIELLPPDMRQQRFDNVREAHYRAGIILADLYLLNKDATKAQDALAGVAAELNASKPQATAPRQLANQYRYERSEYLVRLARLADLQGKPQKALLQYQEYLGQLPRVSVEAEKRDDVKEAKQYYLQHGGAPENWLTWATSAEKPNPREPELSFSTPLPDFEVKDLGGRTWRTSDFKGKVTLLDFWATWCGSCRFELPYIQKIHDRVKDRKDLQVVTISVDDNPGLIEAYLKETHFTFPVLLAKDLAEKIYPVIMVPLTWIIDPQGRRSQEPIFVGEGDNWVTGIIARMEGVRQGEQQP
jgi:thiol-disulfide isomerase/thioredoxin